MNRITTPHTFGLVHGAFHSAECWSEVESELRGIGYNTVSMDLPIDDPDATFDDYADVVVDSLKEHENIMLVGWSRAGNVIPRAAGRLATKGMIFLCAGFDPSTIQRPTPEELPSVPARYSRRYKHALETKDGLLFDINRDIAREVFYNDCEDESVVRRAIRSLRLQRRSPDEPRLEQWPSVPQAYILGQFDQVINPQWSLHACRNWLQIEPIQIPTGHAPNYSQPKLLSHLLVEIAEDLAETD